MMYRCLLVCMLAWLCASCGALPAANAPITAPAVPTTVPAGQSPAAPDLISADIAVSVAVGALQRGVPYLQLIGTPSEVRGALDTSNTPPTWQIAVYGVVAETFVPAAGTSVAEVVQRERWVTVTVDAWTAQYTRMTAELSSYPPQMPVLAVPTGTQVIPTPPDVPVTTPAPTTAPASTIMPSTASLGVIFPQQLPRPGPQAYPAALITGRLERVGACVRLRQAEAISATEESYLPIWPVDMQLSDEAGVPGIRNANGVLLAQVGDTVALGGGVVSFMPGAWQADAASGAGAASDAAIQACGGPFWFASPELRRVGP